MIFRSLVVLALGMMSLPALAKERTLIGDLEDLEHGGFGGPIVRFTQINGHLGVLTGGRGGWIIDHRFVLGGGGYGLANGIEAEGLAPPFQETVGGTVPAVPDLEMGYGGGMLEYIIASDALVHFSVELLVGAGGATTADNWKEDAFFVAEPGANLMLNVTDFFRFGAGASYRYVEGLHFGDIGDDDLSGVTAVLTFKFGKF